MIEECYQKNFGSIFENENGYLCYKEVGGSATSFKVNNINEIQNGYIATVTQYGEESNFELTVNFAIDNTKCIISSYEFNN